MSKIKENLIEVKGLDDWWASINGDAFHIYYRHYGIVAILSPDGHFTHLDPRLDLEKTDRNFKNNPKQAIRYLFLKNQ